MENNKDTAENQINNKADKAFMKPMVSSSIVDRIVSRITNAIINGELLPGQKIPTENELCESMQVGRNSVREAIKSLVAMGVLNIKRAEGTFVAEGFSDRMMDPMVYGMILEGRNSLSMIELRKLFEVGTLKLVIEKANDDDILRIQMALDQLRDVIENNADKNEILEADINFHRTLDIAVSNPLVEKISIIIERLSSPTRIRVIEHFIENNRLMEMYKMHEKILDIIRKRDETAVVGVIDEHFSSWKNELKLLT